MIKATRIAGNSLLVGIIAGLGSSFLTMLVYWFEDPFEKLPFHWMRTSTHVRKLHAVFVPLSCSLIRATVLLYSCIRWKLPLFVRCGEPGKS